jgi:asparagine synthase (glutamine-hydrolysing)
MTPIRFLISIATADKPSTGPIENFGMHQIAAPGFITQHRSAIWIADDRDLLQNTAGVAVVGRVFDRASHLRLASLPVGAAGLASPIERAGRLLSNVWGAWFALLTDRETGRIYVARDPTAHLPVYARELGPHMLFASDIALLIEAGGSKLTVSWRHLADQLRFPELRQADTCLAGIREVAPGALTPIAGNNAPPVQLWDPWTFARRHRWQEPAEAAAGLRETTLSCIGAWASDSARVAVAASGGLDSSIICAALAVQKRPFDCITIATADPSGDESAYVGQLAAALGVRMVRQMFDPAGIDLARPASAGLPRPVRKAFMQELRRAMREGAGELGADVVFDGNGGDNLFCYLHSAAPILDRLWAEGPGTGMMRSIVDMCRMTESDVPTMLRAVVQGLIRAPAPAWIADDRLLARDVQSAPVPIALTPWNLRQRRAPGKAAHIGLIQRAQNFTHDLTGASGPMQFSPLMSQPLLEFCLSVPSWEWCHGGINRSLAREAFRADLPATTLSRTAKAGPDSFLRVVLRRNRRLIREMLHDGLLARHGVLDMAAVEQAVTIDEQADDPIINRLLDLVEAEAWARSWSG